MQRRQVALALSSLGALAAVRRSIAAKTAVRGPLFWLAERGDARVFILGISDAKDRSWFTPAIQDAFERSSTLWEEIAQPPSMASVDQLYDQYGFDPKRTFFDALDPTVRQRAERYMVELHIDRKSIEHMRPWRAYYVFNSAFATRPHVAAAATPTAESENPEFMLLGLAQKSGKMLRYEHPTFEALVQFLAGMSDAAQSQYIAWLLDYFDAEMQGPSAADYAWMTGRGDTGSLDRMRRYPELYRIMQPQRNRRWARQIDTLLDGEGTSFVAIGLLHVLGPDGIPRQLSSLGIQLRESAEFS
jgi:uncharacterized protein YbaP (TraB family)